VSDPAARPGGGHAAAVLAIVCCAQLILAVDITIILVADVQIQHALGFTQASLSWIVTAYALTFGGLLLAGRLSDSFGHRRMFLAGMAAFWVASACAALSGSPLELVASRAVQGMSASPRSSSARCTCSRCSATVRSRLASRRCPSPLASRPAPSPSRTCFATAATASR
jgi:MFS family permease